MPSLRPHGKTALRGWVSVRSGVKAPLMSKDRSEAAPMPATEPNRTQQPATSSRADIDAFLGQVGALDPVVKASERGRLIFALDATMSRQPTWDQACRLQGEMFREAASVGGLDLQLVYYRGLAECRASGWVTEPERFGELMSRIDCRGGQTAPLSWSSSISRDAVRTREAWFGLVRVRIPKLARQSGAARQPFNL